MIVFKSFISLILLLALFSCSKEITQQNDKSNDVSFTELGSDAPYLYGETYNGRKSYVTYYPGNIPVILSIPHGSLSKSLGRYSGSAGSESDPEISSLSEISSSESAQGSGTLATRASSWASLEAGTRASREVVSLSKSTEGVTRSGSDSGVIWKT